MKEIYDLFVEKEKGDWKINKFTVEKSIAMLRYAVQGRPIFEGDYIRLQRKGHTVMSNTPAEIRDFSWFVAEAEGNVLVAGLGLGCVLYALAKKDTVNKVVVIEKEKDVIDLVWDEYKKLFGDKIEIVNADIFEYKPTEKFDFGWFDIWDDICGDNWEEMKTLKKRFAGKVRYKRCWCEKHVKRLSTPTWREIQYKKFNEERERQINELQEQLKVLKGESYEK